MKYSVDYYEGKKESYREIAELIKSMVKMDGIDEDTASVLNSYLDTNFIKCNKQIGIILDTMLEEKRGIYE